MKETKKNKILEELYETGFVQNYSKSIAKEIDWNDIQDITQEIWCQICNLDEDKLMRLYEEDNINGVKKYVAGLVCRQLRSSTSTVYKKYKRYHLIFLPSGLNNDERDEQQ